MTGCKIMTGFELYLGEGANPSTFEFLQSINSDNDYGDGNWQVPLSLPAGQYTLEARGASIHPDSTFQDTSSSTFTVIAPDPNSIDTTYDAHGRVESRIRTWYDPQVEFMPVAVEHHGKREWMARGPDMDADYGSFQGIGGLEAIIDEATGKTTPIIDTVHGHVIATIDLGDPANSTDDVIQYKKQQFGGYGPLPGSTQQPLEVTEDLTASLGWQTRCIDPTRFFAMGARHYDPFSGRFLSADPFGHSATPDLYSYAGGDPINFVDPTGMANEPVQNGRLVAGSYSSSTGFTQFTIYDNGWMSYSRWWGYGETQWYLASASETVNKINEFTGTDYALAAATWILITDIQEPEDPDPDSPEMVEKSRQDAERDMRESGEGDGKVYRVPGEDTPSGKPYIGTTDQENLTDRGSSDGRDRSNAEVISSYPIGDKEQRRQAEQDAIDDAGGIENLDNKRNEIDPVNGKNPQCED